MLSTALTAALVCLLYAKVSDSTDAVQSSNVDGNTRSTNLASHQFQENLFKKGLNVDPMVDTSDSDSGPTNSEFIDITNNTDSVNLVSLQKQVNIEEEFDKNGASIQDLQDMSADNFYDSNNNYANGINDFMD